MTVYSTAPHSDYSWSIMTWFNSIFGFNPVYTLKYQELNQYFTDICIFRSDSNNKLSKKAKIEGHTTLEMIQNDSRLFGIIQD